MKAAVLILFGLVVLGCKPKEAELTPQDLKAQYAYDLGPDSIDIYSYPAAQQEAYSLFRARCSRCHTLARPINAPLSSRREWLEYVERMNKKSGGILLAPAEKKRIVDFLVFDAQRRKSTPEFKKESEERRRRFERVQQARAGGKSSQVE